VLGHARSSPITAVGCWPRAGIVAALASGWKLVSASAGAPVLQGSARPAALIGRLHQPLTLLLLQMIVVIAAARLLGRAFRRIGPAGGDRRDLRRHPARAVAAGPAVAAALASFPAGALAPLQLLSQIGVLLFMFAWAWRWSLAELRRQRAAPC